MKNAKTAWVHSLTLSVTSKPQDDPTWIKFHSRHEAVRYTELRAREIAGEVRRLRRQVAFPLNTVGPRGLATVTRYFADFVYEEPEPGLTGVWREVVEDAKGWRTDIYKLKRKWLECQYGVTIRES